MVVRQEGRGCSALLVAQQERFQRPPFSFAPPTHTYPPRRLTQQEDIANIDVVGGHIHREQLQVPLGSLPRARGAMHLSQDSCTETPPPLAPSLATLPRAQHRARPQQHPPVPRPPGQPMHPGGKTTTQTARQEQRHPPAGWWTL